MDFDNSIVVIDNGSRTIKAGEAGEDTPKIIFPTIVGKNTSGDNYIGYPARDRRGLIPLGYPIEHGIITNWDDMERIWRYTFYDELRLVPEEHPIFLTEVPSNPANNREKTTQMVFENLGSPAMYLVSGGLATLYSMGKFTGLVVESGDGITYTIPIIDGKVIKEGVLNSNLAGQVLTDYLMKQPHLAGPLSSNKEIIEDIKEKLCYVANDWTNETKVNPDLIKQIYPIPSIGDIPVGQERFNCPEILFQPSTFGIEGISIHEMISNSIAKCDPTYRADLYQNIILGGGNTLFSGMIERLEKELKAISPSIMKINILGNAERGTSAWHGGSIMATNSGLVNNWITKSQYDEVGPSIVTTLDSKL